MLPETPRFCCGCKTSQPPAPHRRGSGRYRLGAGHRPAVSEKASSAWDIDRTQETDLAESGEPSLGLNGHDRTLEGRDGVSNGPLVTSLVQRQLDSVRGNSYDPHEASPQSRRHGERHIEFFLKLIRIGCVPLTIVALPVNREGRCTVDRLEAGRPAPGRFIE